MDRDRDREQTWRGWLLLLVGVAALLVNAPAARATSATVALMPGTLSISPTYVRLTYDVPRNRNVRTLYSTFSFTVTDATGSKEGWDIRAVQTATTSPSDDPFPSDDHHIIDADVTNYTGAWPDPAIIGTEIPKVPTVIFRAAQKTGMGQSTELFSTEVKFPWDTDPGRYTSTLLLTVTPISNASLGPPTGRSGGGAGPSGTPPPPPSRGSTGPGQVSIGATPVPAPISRNSPVNLPASPAMTPNTTAPNTVAPTAVVPKATASTTGNSNGVSQSPAPAASPAAAAPDGAPATTIPIVTRSSTTPSSATTPTDLAPATTIPVATAPTAASTAAPIVPTTAANPERLSAGTATPINVASAPQQVPESAVDAPAAPPAPRTSQTTGTGSVVSSASISTNASVLPSRPVVGSDVRDRVAPLRADALITYPVLAMGDNVLTFAPPRAANGGSIRGAAGAWHLQLACCPLTAGEDATGSITEGATVDITPGATNAAPLMVFPLWTRTGEVVRVSVGMSGGVTIMFDTSGFTARPSTLVLMLTIVAGP